MADIVNTYFKQFYPADLKDEDFADEHWSGLGPMRRYRGKRTKVSTIFPAITCADGFKMSVQGHNGAYSTPRDDFADHYTRVEIGFPSEREESLMPYIDGDETTDPTQTVYGYVPIETVVAIIEKHGGIAA